MSFLVFNRREILADLVNWFPDSARSLVVLTAESVLGGQDAARLAKAFRHLEVVADYSDPGVAAIAERMCRDYAVEAILTTAEADVVRAARLRARLGLPGQDLDSAVAYRDKYVMKTMAGAAGVPVAPMRLVRRAADVIEFAESSGFPIVIKPVDGASSIGMRVLSDKRDVGRLSAEWQCHPPAKPELAEAWVDGEQYHVDGLMSQGGVVQSLRCRYLHTQWLSTSQSMPLISGMLDARDGLRAELERAARKVIAALPPAPGLYPFHAEFFRAPGGEIVLCEIACRAGGGGVVEAYQLSTGVNLYQASLLGQAGRADLLDFRGRARRNGHGSWFPPRRHARLRRLPDPALIAGTERYRPARLARCITDRDRRRTVLPTSFSCCRTAM